ncbi:MAG: DUF1674 domain-containing protein [Arenicellales bacterium]|nr:DUF1674 domain-containing protein [Acidiferrobacteraceae bacterium]MDP6289005.1 DUF1674 domain-containing protein [Arenicellales bacterium]MBT58275.1 DUF1674 domain-containing protein [Acidiferrobacteraceae bacterium]MBT58599.1 DUF1674 domain-containing protein [Acidiferrobacteraceae bacterium]MDP6435555.1 DUF1674 domain-containing protein [Arenicellales bacterium]
MNKSKTRDLGPEESPSHPEKKSRVDGDSDQKTEGAPREIGGRKGPDPTRYGDWEKKGRCIDF